MTDAAAGTTYPVLFQGRASAGQPKCCIYGLFDPREPQIVRYVGQTGCVYQRYGQHLKPSETTRGRWIGELFLAGVLPGMVLLETVEHPGLLPDRERFWIAKLKAEGQADINGLLTPRRPKPYARQEA